MVLCVCIVVCVLAAQPIAYTYMQNFGGVPVHDASEHSVVVHGSGASLGHC